MSSQPIQPLRIQKTSPATSPFKMSGSGVQRPLSELGSTERRRNSPSYNQASKRMLFSDSSPFENSPRNNAPSPRLFWQGRDAASPGRVATENRNPLDRDGSPSPSKRSSIENLKKASRVRNSNMFAREHKQEYDPTSPTTVERPLAGGRPLSTQFHGNAFSGRGLDGIRSPGARDIKIDGANKRTSYQSPMSPPLNQDTPFATSPSKTQVSPAKSSLSRASRYGNKGSGFDPENGFWPEDGDDIFQDRKLPEGRSLHRHAKSVTFDAAPPQVNEYEMTTPDPSSIASGSREGSYDDDDEEEESFDRGSSLDRDDSFDESLEDTDKTPVVMPEDWRFMSPEVANDELTTNMEDPFEPDVGSPPPTALPSMTQESRHSQARVESTDSNGQARPLPPLPPLGTPSLPKTRSNSNSSLTASVERTSSAQRVLPSPPRPASISKSEIKGMGSGSMGIEDRLKLMMLADQEKGQQSEADKQRERRMRRAGTKERSPGRDDSPDIGLSFRNLTLEEDVPGATRAFENLNLGSPATNTEHSSSPPRISRESILRKIQSQNFEAEEEDIYDYSSPDVGSSPERPLEFDPDQPIPSIENIAALDEDKEDIVVKTEPIDDDFDPYSVPDLYAENQDVVSKLSEYDEQGQEDDDASEYSQPTVAEEENQSTPRAQSPNRPVNLTELDKPKRSSLPDFSSSLGNSTFALGLGPYLSSSIDEPTKSDHSRMASSLETLERPVTPEEDEVEEPGTPDSVIRHPTGYESPTLESPSIPEPDATIKAPGGGLKTRPSLTPADAEAMRDVRRQVSGQAPAVPPIPERHRDRPSLGLDHPSMDRPASKDSEFSQESQDSQGDSIGQEEGLSVPASIGKRQSSLVQLDIPVPQNDEDLGFGLDKEFDRVIEAQKVAFDLSYQSLVHNQHASQSRKGSTSESTRASPGAEYIGTSPYSPITDPIANRSTLRQRGYLMRQNTKVIVASSRPEDPPNVDPAGSAQFSGKDADGQDGTKSAGASPRKGSNSKTWTTEPWNGKIRRKSIRVPSSESPRRKMATGPVPPLPGQASNVAAGLGSVEEDQAVEENEEFEDGSERGRVFVKVVGVKDLALPLPKGERSYFALTLDNGLHCVTTAWLELGRSAPIGQEFELVVLNDLEFQLTLQMKLEEPRQKPQESPSKALKVEKKSTFSRVFASPKKRKELELRHQLEAAQLKEQNSKPKQPSCWDLVNSLVARDGSFARAYVCLSEHEKQAYGRPYTVDVPCYNEWAIEESSSVKSKRSQNNGVQRRPPYQIGRLELQLLYVPKPKGAKDEDMPKSMNACIREMREAEAVASKKWEGHLSQQGGDCPYWRRRFFRLSGSKLTAYHDTTHQPRATINLAKAAKLIDDKSTLTQRETSTKGGGRRKSAFSEEEEGYMFVEEGFRIRFANGEVIDFYADSAAEKDAWMKALSEVVGKETKSGSARAWTEMVLKRERSMAAKAAARAPGVPRKESSEAKEREWENRRMDREQERNVNAMKSAPNSPVKKHNPMMRPGSAGGIEGHVPAPVEKSPRHQHQRSEQLHMAGHMVGGAGNMPRPRGSLLTGNMSRAERDKKVRSMFM